MRQLKREPAAFEIAAIVDSSGGQVTLGRYLCCMRCIPPASAGEPTEKLITDDRQCSVVPISGYSEQNIFEQMTEGAHKELEANKSTEKNLILIFGRRKIAEGKTEELKAAFSAASEALRGRIPKLKAMYANVDLEDESYINDTLLFGDEAAFDEFALAQQDEKVAAWLSLCSGEWSGTVFGASEGVSEKLKGMGASMKVLDPKWAGYMRGSANGIEEPPIIVYNRRTVQEGKLDDVNRRMQQICDYYYANLPGLMGIAHCPDQEDPLVVHDMRIFADMAAFQGHVNMEVPEIKVLFEAWFEFYNHDVPFVGDMVLPEAMVEPVREETSSHGAKFKLYPWEKTLGGIDLTQGDD